MDLDILRNMGLVHSNPMVKRAIKVAYFPLLPRAQWADPDVEERQKESVEGEVTVFLRKMTAADQMAVREAVRAKRDPLYVVLHRTVFTEKGARLFASEEEAMGLNLEMFVGLVQALNLLNGDFAKKSTPNASSGAKSRSHSADDQSPNGRTRSPPTNMKSGSSTESNTAP